MGASLGSSFCFFKCSFLKHPSHVDIKRFLDFVLQVSNVSWNTCLVAKFWMSRRQVKSGRRFLTLPDKEVKRNIALGKFWMIYQLGTRFCSLKLYMMFMAVVCQGGTSLPERRGVHKGFMTPLSFCPWSFLPLLKEPFPAGRVFWQLQWIRV